MSAPDPEPTPAGPRTLIVCFDGTADQYDGQNTNVVNLFSLLVKDERQLCYYQPGIGTYSAPGILTPLALWCSKILDEAVAWYLDAHVMGGYTFLMQAYNPGDKICIFGFSRGAYTARALAGMLAKVGLLPRNNPEQVPFAYKMFSNTSASSIEQCAGFKQTFCRSVEIDFLGVWDTVASVGVIMTKTLPFTNSNTIVKTFRHALSLDERRAKFRPTLYHRPVPNEDAGKDDPEHASPIDPSYSASTSLGQMADAIEAKSSNKTLWSKFKSKKSKTKAKVQAPQVEASTNESTAGVTTSSQAASELPKPKINVSTVPEPDIKEVWFSGCHSDIGGGSTDNGAPYSLQYISFRWMLKEIVENCTIRIDMDALSRLNLTPDEIGMKVSTNYNTESSDSASPTTAPSTSDLHNFAQPKHDQLVAQPLWWLLEIVPTPFSWQDKNNVWHRKWSFHLGKGRYIPEEKPLFHESVEKRIADTSLKYYPKARFTAGSQVYVA